MATTKEKRRKASIVILGVVRECEELVDAVKFKGFLIGEHVETTHVITGQHVITCKVNILTEGDVFPGRSFYIHEMYSFL